MLGFMAGLVLREDGWLGSCDRLTFLLLTRKSSYKLVSRKGMVLLVLVYYDCYDSVLLVVVVEVRVAGTSIGPFSSSSKIFIYLRFPQNSIHSEAATMNLPQ